MGKLMIVYWAYIQGACIELDDSDDDGHYGH